MTDEEQLAAPEPGPPATWRHWRVRTWVVLGVAAFLALVVALQVLAGSDAFNTISEASGDNAYLAVFILVTLDGICAIFPGETTINTASTLAAQGVLTLWPVIVAGALGAICGDSGLYWIARSQRHRYQDKLDRARANPKFAKAWGFVGESASTMLVAGRFLPGMRLAVNATLGVQAHPYKHFLLWSAIGGTLWSIYNCTLAYLIGTALTSYPLASIAISSVVTTVALAAVLLMVRRARRKMRGQEPVSAEESSPQP